MSSEMRDIKALVDLVVGCIANGRRDEALIHAEQAQNALARALLARTEAGADGRIDHHKAMQALEDLDDCARMDVGIAATGPYDLLRRYIMQQNRSHPQDASGDAERFAAVMNCQWLRSSKYGDQVFGWREEFLSRVNAEVAAMQAKEAK